MGAFSFCSFAELQGRLPVRVHLEALTESDLLKILTDPQSRCGTLTQRTLFLFVAFVLHPITGLMWRRQPDEAIRGPNGNRRREVDVCPRCASYAIAKIVLWMVIIK